MIYNPESMRFITQRQFPKMALITTTFVDNYLQLDFEGMSTLMIGAKGSVQTRGPVVEDIGLWKVKVKGVDEGDKAAKWFQKVLQSDHPVRLIRMLEDHDRCVPKKWRHEDMAEELVSYADGFPFLLATEASLADLNSRLPNGTIPLPMRRFRPNFIIQGEVTPFEEDSWKKIQIGNTVFRLSKPCSRCKVTTVDPDKGEFGGEEPLETLKTFRKGIIPKDKDKVFFGQNLVHESTGGSVQIGDPVFILEMSSD